jgi:tetratricopeptide (TPR) repeat protein
MAKNVMLCISILMAIVLLAGCSLAADIPFVFDDRSSDSAGLASVRLEEALSGSFWLAAVPSASSPSDQKREDDLKKTVGARVEPDNPTIQEVALLLVAKYPGNLTIDQICSIYRYMKRGDGSVKGWSYARDPRGSDFFMYANQSIEIGGKSSRSGVGDCDDFAILMSSLVGAIGGNTRIIFAQNKTTGGHAYAEVYLGNLGENSRQIDKIIEWLKQTFNTNKIFTHIDTETKDVWLNLDWGADEKGSTHPGGPLYQEDRHFIAYRNAAGKTPLKLNSITKKMVEPSHAMPLNITEDEIKSNSVAVWFNKGFALESMGRYEEAIKAYDEVIRRDPEYAPAWNNKGVSLNKQGKYDYAINRFDEAIRLDPNFADAWYNKGISLGQLGRYDEEIIACDKAIQLDPNLAEAWANKGYALGQLGRYDEEIIACDKAIRIKPDLAVAWSNKGCSLDAQGRYDEAIGCFDEAIRLDSENAESWNNKGTALRNQEKYDEAIDCFDEAIRLDPSYAMAWNNKGSVLGQLGNYEDEINAYERAIQLKPDLAGAWYNKGISLGLQGKYDESLRAFNECIRLDPNFANAYYGKGIALKKLGRITESGEAFSMA